MRFRIRPVETSFYDLFTEMANHLVEGANLLAQMLDSSTDKKALGEQMREAEHQADETTHKIVKRANSTFITPFDREDIYRLASSLDDVMDFMEETVDLVGLYELGDLPADFAPQVEVLQRATQLTARLRAHDPAIDISDRSASSMGLPHPALTGASRAFSHPTGRNIVLRLVHGDG